MILVFGLLGLTVSGCMESALADTDGADPPGAVRADFEPLYWAYSSFFGTGWYEVDDEGSVFVLRVPPRQTLRHSSISETGERTLGIELRYPLTMGLHDVQNLAGIVGSDNFGTVAFAPGVEVEIPINPQWYLRTFAHLGWGKELDKGESAWIYYTGVKSQYRFPSNNQYQWYLLNSLYYAGYTPDRGRSDHLAVAEIGVEFQQPLKKARLMGRPLDLHWNLMYSFLGNDIHFNLPEGSFDPTQDQFEIGLQASFRDGPLKLWIFTIHRFGLGYRFSSNGEFSAITFSTRSWFTK